MEIENCKTCGNEPHLHTVTGAYDVRHWVECAECGLSGCYFPSREEAVNNWNDKKAPEGEELQLTGKQELHAWFGLTRSSFLTIPRSFMQEMPDDWQMKMAKLLAEYDATFDQSKVEIDGVFVMGRKDGKNCKMPEWITNYRHPDRALINSMKYKEGDDD